MLTLVSYAKISQAVPLIVQFLIGPEVISCEGFLEEPENSDMICSDGKSVGSVCEFICNIGFARVGAESSTCVVDLEHGIKWNKEPPTCKRGKFLIGNV